MDLEVERPDPKTVTQKWLSNYGRDYNDVECAEPDRVFGFDPVQVVLGAFALLLLSVLVVMNQVSTSSRSYAIDDVLTEEMHGVKVYGCVGGTRTAGTTIVNTNDHSIQLIEYESVDRYKDRLAVKILDSGESIKLNRVYRFILGRIAPEETVIWVDVLRAPICSSFN